jgi:hypothetical protein
VLASGPVIEALAGSSASVRRDHRTDLTSPDANARAP